MIFVVVILVAAAATAATLWPASWTQIIPPEVWWPIG